MKYLNDSFTGKILMSTTDSEVYAKTLIKTPNDENANSFLQCIQNDEGNYFLQENSYFDYKKEFPHSMSDSYFGGIIKLIFAFYNTFGGILILGVDDTSRKPGKNKKNVNVEKLCTRIRETSGRSIKINHLSCGQNESKVDLLVVEKRAPNIPPIKLIRSIAKYKLDTIWIRKGHEAIESESNEVGFLFSSRDDEDVSISNDIKSNLPPNPALIKNFVGRVDVLSKLVDWVVNEDEPRKYLHGRGGSGKSSVAFEFAKIIERNAKHVELYQENYFDRVVYLSAKEKSFKPKKRQIIAEEEIDFSNSDELIRAMCIACDFADHEEIIKMDRKELEKSLKIIFEHESILFIIDDIDTLSTKGIETGQDFLYKLCIRAPQLIRILYTQRKESDAIENCIKVNGFTKEKDFNEFTEKCCKLFQIEPLTDDKNLAELKNITEGIPLIMETVIGLKKVCGSYKSAFEEFSRKSGKEARKYLFEREYEALPKDDRARYVLLIIATLDKSVVIDDIINCSTLDKTVVIEVIDELLGFFLSYDTNSKGETVYLLNQVTSTYVKEAVQRLPFKDKVIETTKYYKKGIIGKPKEIFAIEREMENYIKQNDFNDLETMFSRKYPAKITENPEFRKLRATMFLALPKPKLVDAREDFLFCQNMRFEDIKMMRNWLRMEQKNDGSFSQKLAICNSVIEGKSYSQSSLHEFISNRSGVYHYEARNRNQVDAQPIYLDALKDSLEAHSYFERTQHFSGARQKIHSIRNAESFISCGIETDNIPYTVNAFREIHNTHNYLPSFLFSSIRFLITEIQKIFLRKNCHKMQGILQQIKSDINKSNLSFEDRELNSKLISLINKTMQAKKINPRY